MFTLKEVNKLIEDFSFIKPMKGFVLVKKLDEDKPSNNKGLVKAGLSEEKPYGILIGKCLDSTLFVDLGDFVMFNEAEGQELERIPGHLKEDKLIIIPEDGIMADINIKLE